MNTNVVLFLMVLAIVVWWAWLIHAKWFPIRKCPRCNGAKELKSPIIGLRARICPRCKGTGLRGR